MAQTLLPESDHRLRGDVAIGLAEALYFEGDVPAARQAYLTAIELCP